MEIRPPFPLTEQAKLTTVFSPHPLRSVLKDVRQSAWVNGRSVREHLFASGIDAHAEIVVFLDGRLLTVDEWDRISPDSGSIINAEVVVSGGGGLRPFCRLCW